MMESLPELNKRGGGRPPNLRREAYMMYFQFYPAFPSKTMPNSLLDRLDSCKSDEARRLILGISK